MRLDVVNKFFSLMTCSCVVDEKNLSVTKSHPFLSSSESENESITFLVDNSFFKTSLRQLW